MATKPIPHGYHTVTPYLVTPNAAAVIDFAKTVFGAEEVVRMASPDGRVMHPKALSFLLEGKRPEAAARPAIAEIDDEVFKVSVTGQSVSAELISPRGKRVLRWTGRSILCALTAGYPPIAGRRRTAKALSLLTLGLALIG